MLWQKIKRHALIWAGLLVTVILIGVFTMLWPYFLKQALLAGWSDYFPKMSHSNQLLNFTRVKKLPSDIDDLSKWKFYHSDQYLIPLPISATGNSRESEYQVEAELLETSSGIDVEWTYLKSSRPLWKISPLPIIPISAWENLPLFFQLGLAEDALLKTSQETLVQYLLKRDLRKRPKSFLEMTRQLWAIWKRKLFFPPLKVKAEILLHEKTPWTEIRFRKQNEEQRSIFVGAQRGHLIALQVVTKTLTQSERTTLNKIIQKMSYRPSSPARFHQILWEAEQLRKSPKTLLSFYLLSMSSLSHLEWPVEPVVWLAWKQELLRRSGQNFYRPHAKLEKKILKNLPYKTLEEYHSFQKRQQNTLSQAQDDASEESSTPVQSIFPRNDSQNNNSRPPNELPRSKVIR